MIISTFLESVLGLKVCLIIGSCFISTGMFLAGSATQIWHLYLWIGLCCGCGCSIFTSIAMKIVPEWFDRKLNTAMGISVSSAALGGFAFPFVMTYFNDLLGATWALRCLSISFIAINIVVCSVIRKRRSPTPRKRVALDEIIRLGLLRDVNVIIWCAVGFFQVLSNYVPFTFLPSYATYIGLSPFQGSAVISIASLISVVGRIYAGYLADSIGNINTCFIFMFLSGIASIVVWTLARNYFSLLVFASLFGFFGGVYNALQGPIAVKLFGLENYSAGYTLIMLLNCPAIFGPTIASAIEARSDGEPFLTYKLFYGLASIISAMIVLVLKFRIGQSLTAKV
ncbi:hypothetical protein O0I10_007739 [Lichtheimia ornata]|uniref:Major facilitator superfamily (MFS) profile domain-containing protein n=1 Tax=Lichtheimia ornata TaxID=688661 RepID=A0AAD7XW43_9FUNG|nr:uncharacterized protein O0I10_007739 [Lichtheimia ornata]KAJ8656660.1 hypothetical protein O0I10_007739 [Lichtheimia ornata]